MGAISLIQHWKTLLGVFFFIISKFCLHWQEDNEREVMVRQSPVKTKDINLHWRRDWKNHGYPLETGPRWCRNWGLCKNNKYGDQCLQAGSVPVFYPRYSYNSLYKFSFSAHLSTCALGELLQLRFVRHVSFARLPSRGHSFGLILIKIGQNVCPYKILVKFEYGYMGSKTRSRGQINGKPCVHSRGHIFGWILIKLDENICLYLCQSEIWIGILILILCKSENVLTTLMYIILL